MLKHTEASLGIQILRDDGHRHAPGATKQVRVIQPFVRSGIVVLFLVILFSGMKASAAVSAADLFEMMAPSVVRIFQIDDDGQVISQGSGFFIEGGLIVTNNHVVDDRDARYIVETYGGSVIPVIGLLGEDQANDLAILRVGTNRVQPILIRVHGELRIGSTVYVLGSPLGLQNTISDGLLSGIRERDGKTKLQLTAPISPGSSGGPVFNEDAELIGIVVSLVEEGQNINFAIPLDALNKLVASVSGRTPTESNTFTTIEDIDKQTFIDFRVAKLLAEARFQAKAKDNRTEAFKMIAAAMRLDPDSKEPPHVLRTILKPNERTCGEVANATLKTHSPQYRGSKHYDSVVIVDIAIRVKSDVGGRTEITFPGLKEPIFTGPEPSQEERERVIANMSYSAEVDPELTRELPSDPEGYLSGEIVRIKATPIIVKGWYRTGVLRNVGGQLIDVAYPVHGFRLWRATEFEVLSK